MAQSYDTTELLVQIRKHARVGDDDPDATDTILLENATEILQSVYAPLVRTVRSDYYVTTKRIALAAGRSGYPIPRRAVTSSVRRVRLLDANSRELGMVQVPYEDILSSRTGVRPAWYAITDDKILVAPVPTVATYTLEVAYEYRPSALIVPDLNANTHALVVSEAYDSPTADTHTVAVTPSFFTNDDMIDIVHKDAPFSSPVIDATVDARTGGAFLDLLSYSGVQEPVLGLVLGDYVCFAGETPVPQIPAELHPILAKHTAADWLDPIDPDSARNLRNEADKALKEAIKAMAPRKTGTQMKMRPTAGGIRTSGRRGFRNPWGDWTGNG